MRDTATAGTSWPLPTGTSTPPKCESLRSLLAQARVSPPASVGPGHRGQRAPATGWLGAPDSIRAVRVRSACCSARRTRIFLLGPSHHKYTRRCMLSSTEAYDTPLGARGGAGAWGARAHLGGAGRAPGRRCAGSRRGGTPSLGASPSRSTEEGHGRQRVGQGRVRVLRWECGLMSTSACLPDGNAGSMPIDQQVYSELQATGEFDVMDVDTDEVRASLFGKGRHAGVCLRGHLMDRGELAPLWGPVRVMHRRRTPPQHVPRDARTRSAPRVQRTTAGGAQPGAAHAVHCADHGGAPLHARAHHGGLADARHVSASRVHARSPPALRTRDLLQRRRASQRGRPPDVGDPPMWAARVAGCAGCGSGAVASAAAGARAVRRCAERPAPEGTRRARGRRNLTCRCGCREAKYGAILGPYLDDPSNCFVVSSDFCHWGSRFSYTFYDKSQVCTPRARCTDGRCASQPERCAGACLWWTDAMAPVLR